MPGGRKLASITTYPEDSIQSAISPSAWWVPDDTHDFKPGVLIRAFMPHVQQVPYVIVPEGRDIPTEHKTFKAKIEPLDVKNPHRLSKLPVACLPVYPNEVRAVYSAKKRPAIVVKRQQSVMGIDWGGDWGSALSRFQFRKNASHRGCRLSKVLHNGTLKALTLTGHLTSSPEMNALLNKCRIKIKFLNGYAK